jgi:asparagine synthase (glutamine-hydrolysing)
VCGIVGQARTDRVTPEAALIARMCAALEHRGPDSRGVHVEPGVGLGIQRLRVIDLDTGDQPIFNEDRSVAVVLNGEIYNYRELRAQLLRRGHRFATAGDTEVIAHLYEERGPDCVRELHGMFAVAIWDARAQRLTLARDRVGKKPLFYALRDGALTFASELNALMQNQHIPRELDYEALDAYLSYQYVPVPLSVYQAVRKLPAASTLVFADGRARIERYWRLDYRRKLAAADEREYDEQLREQLRRAVRMRMRADVPLGTFLSGGIDSSAVLAAMAEISSQPVKTFSIGFSSDCFNELPRARLVAERFGTEHHELVVEPDAVELLPRIVEQYGEPFGDSSALPSFHLAELAGRHVTVALNGDGGDESFAGYSHYAANLLLGRLDAIPRPLRALLARAGTAIPASGQVDSTLSRARRLTETLALTPAQRFAAYRSQLDGLVAERLYTASFREQLGGSRADSAIEASWRESLSEDVLDRMLGVDVENYLSGQLLTKVDIATMAHSLEARSPLLDHELMQFAASLPGEQKLHRGQRKVALRRALRGWVPDAVLDGPKQGFSLPLSEWFRGELREWAREILLDQGAVRRGYFDERAVVGLLDGHVRGQRDDSRGIWTLLVFELWHRRFCDAPLVAPPARGSVALASATTSS